MFGCCLYLGPGIDAGTQWYIITLIVINGQRDKCAMCTFSSHRVYDANKACSICNYLYTETTYILGVINIYQERFCNSDISYNIYMGKRDQTAINSS